MTHPITGFKVFNLSDGTLRLDFRDRLGKVLTCAPSPPPPPDYAGAAQAQGQANIDAARTQGRINNPNVYNPYGSQTVTWNGDQPTVIQTLSGPQQAILNQQNQNRLEAGQLANRGLDSLGNIIGTGVNFQGAPPAPGSATDTRTKVINAMMSRVDEDTARQRDELNSNLVAAGIRPGSKAYDDRMALLDRGYNDARNQAFLASGQEASRDFGMDSERRRQAIGELLTQRQVPLNEITALMSGSQVSNPFSMPSYAQNAQVAPAPVFGATQALGDYNADLYNVRAAQAGNLQSGLFGLGGAGIMGGAMLLSDRRLKSNVVRIGTHPLGIGVYEYDIFGRRERGVMADEVKAVMPEAVVKMGEYDAVRYDLIGGRPA